MSTPALAGHGSDELKRKYLAPRHDGRDGDVGSSVRTGRRFRRCRIKTRAVRDGDDWVINGRKMWITSGTQADWICLLARTSDEGGYMGMSQIIVPTDTPGFSVGRAIKKMGNHRRTPASLYSRKSGFRCRTRSARSAAASNSRCRSSRMSDSSPRTWCGLDAQSDRPHHRVPAPTRCVRQAAVGEPVHPVPPRRVRSRRSTSSPSTRTPQARLRRGRGCVAHGDDREAEDRRLQREVADACVQFHGGMGYAEEMWPARYFRDGRLTSIGGGADEVMLRVIAMMEGMGKKCRSSCAWASVWIHTTVCVAGPSMPTTVRYP